jgi:hypothetical protein
MRAISLAWFSSRANRHAATRAIADADHMHMASITTLVIKMFDRRNLKCTRSLQGNAGASMNFGQSGTWVGQMVRRHPLVEALPKIARRGT